MTNETECALKKLLSVIFLTALLAVGFPATASATTQDPATAVVDIDGIAPEVLEHFNTATEFPEEGEQASDGGDFQILSTVRITSRQPGTRMPNIMLSCSNPGGRCSLTETVTITSTISGSTGVNFRMLNASLGGSHSQSITRTASCTSPRTLRFQEIFAAYPEGTFVMFTYNGRNGTAFLPTGLACRITTR